MRYASVTPRRCPQKEVGNQGILRGKPCSWLGKLPRDPLEFEWTAEGRLRHARCGRYVTPEEAAVEREYHIDRANSRLRLDAEIDRAFLQSFNVVPTHNVPVVRVIRGRNGEREAVLMRWGLIPSLRAASRRSTRRSMRPSRNSTARPHGAARGSAVSAASCRAPASTNGR